MNELEDEPTSPPPSLKRQNALRGIKLLEAMTSQSPAAG